MQLINHQNRREEEKEAKIMDYLLGSLCQYHGDRPQNIIAHPRLLI